MEIALTHTQTTENVFISGWKTCHFTITFCQAPLYIFCLAFNWDRIPEKSKHELKKGKKNVYLNVKIKH